MPRTDAADYETKRAGLPVDWMEVRGTTGSWAAASEPRQRLAGHLSREEDVLVAMERQANVGRGVAAGIVGGLLGSWVMLKFIEGSGPALERRLQGRPEPTGKEAEQQAAATESVTMQAAETFYHAGTGGHLTHEERAVGGEVVHYAFGGLMGVAYGVAAEYLPVVRVGMGAAFGTVLWAGTDLVSVPAAGFAAWPTEEPGSAHVAHWMAHLVYGVTMEGTRRLVGRML